MNKVCVIPQPKNNNNKKFNNNNSSINQNYLKNSPNNLNKLISRLISLIVCRDRKLTRKLRIKRQIIINTNNLTPLPLLTSFNLLKHLSMIVILKKTI